MLDERPGRRHVKCELVRWALGGLLGERSGHAYEEVDELVGI